MPFDDQLEWAPGSGFDPVSVCKTDPEHRYTRPRRPLKVVLQSLVPTTDFLWTVYNDCLVTSPIRDVLLSHHITGIEFKPVLSFASSGFEVDLPLFELVPHGWGGMVSKESKLRIAEYCSSCGRTVFSTYENGRISFDMDAWDGSDYFIIWPFPVFKCVSPAFADLIKTQQWTGVEFLSFDDWRPEFVKTLTPGLVTNWIAGEKGRRLQSIVDAEIAKRWPDQFDK